MRLSREDGDKEESSSITNQRSMLTRYVEEQDNFILVKEYVDDGYSGITFDRPKFQEMLRDLQDGVINTVVTKDLSRLGRERLKVGYYTEIYFPENDIRYISILDNIDTYLDGGLNEIAPFKQVINDMYVRDISKKMRSAIKEKKMAGNFLGVTAPYGYMKDPLNNFHLVINENEAQVVRKIYSLFLAGNGLTKIAQILTNEQIEVPGKSRKIISRGVTKLYDAWKQTTISRILRNPVYIGNLEQFKRQTINYKVKKRKTVPKSERYICENTHDAIIDKETFNKVQKILEKNTSFKGTKHDYLLKGLLYCKECGAKLYITYSYYMYKKTGKYNYTTICYSYSKLYNDICTRHSNRMEDLETVVLDNVKEVCKQYMDENLRSNLIELAKKEAIQQNNFEEIELNKIKQKLEELSKITIDLYKDKSKGIITEEEYVQMHKEFVEEKEKNLIRKNELEKSLKEKSVIEFDNARLEKLVKEYLSLKRPTKELLNQLINRIEVAEDGSIDIYFNFKELFNTHYENVQQLAIEG